MGFFMGLVLGLACGLGLIVAFVHVENARSKMRRDLVRLLSLLLLLVFWLFFLWWIHLLKISFWWIKVPLFPPEHKDCTFRVEVGWMHDCMLVLFIFFMNNLFIDCWKLEFFIFCFWIGKNYHIGSPKMRRGWRIYDLPCIDINWWCKLGFQFFYKVNALLGVRIN